MANVGEFDLRSGRRIELCELRQYCTYEGLIEGLPTAERNKQRLEQLVADHRDKPYPGGPYLIRPTETPIEYLQGEPYPFGTPSALPAITCIGRFTSLDPVSNKSLEYASGLMVIWSQNEFAFPIDPDVAAQILEIDWEAHAGDFGY